MSILTITVRNSTDTLIFIFQILSVYCQIELRKIFSLLINPAFPIAVVLRGPHIELYGQRRCYGCPSANSPQKIPAEASYRGPTLTNNKGCFCHNLVKPFHFRNACYV